MITEIIKGVIATLVIAGAIASVFLKIVEAQTFLIPLAAFAFGYYFKQVEPPVVTKFKVAYGKK